MSKTYLFIGGPADGKVYALTDPPPFRMVFPVVRDRKAIYFDSGDVLHDGLSFDKVVYKEMRFAGKKDYHVVYVLDGMDTDEVLRRLITEYKGASDER